MAFHEVRFPEDIARMARIGTERRTDVVALASGREERNGRWADSRRRYDVGFGVRSADDLHAILAFWEARQGRLHGFRFKDWSDYRSGPPLQPGVRQTIGTGDGTATEFQLTKTYGAPPHQWLRRIAKPVAGSVGVWTGAGAGTPAEFTLDESTGIVTLAAAPAAGLPVQAAFEFDVPVRFDLDAFDIELDIDRLGSVPSIPLVEIRP